MTKLINGQKVDISKCTKILDVDAHIGRRTLLKTKAGNFLTMEQTLSEFPPEIVPMTRGEALEFLQIHQETITQDHYWRILKTHFNIVPETKDHSKVPFGAVQIAKKFGLEPESLYQINPGGKFFVKSGSEHKEVTKTRALQWIEQNQDDIKDLDKILKNHFPTITNY